MNRTAPTISLLALLAACGSDSTAEFGPARTVPKSQRPTVWNVELQDRLGVPDMNAAQASAGPAEVQSTTPTGWEELPANPAGFRNAVWRVEGEPDSDCYLTLGVGGGIEGNLARWYGQQFGNAEVPSVESLPTIDLLGRRGHLAEIEGTFGGKPEWAALIAFFGEGQQVTSLKFTGPKAVVQANRDQFLLLAHSLRLGKPSAPSPAAASGAGGSADKVIASTPAGWEELAPNPKRFRNAVWRVQGEPETDCYLTLGVGGGVAGNLMRWYQQQFGAASTPPVESLPMIEFMGQNGHLAEIAGTFDGKPGWAALIAFVSEGQQVTSLKFTGPKALVDANREQFLQLSRSMRLGSGKGDAVPAPAIEPGQTLPAGHMPIGGGATGSNPAQAATGPFTATVPDGWQPQAGSSRLFHHSFGTTGEVYISQLGGTLKPTLDIWRGEIGLGPMSDAEFAALPKTLFLGDDSLLADLTGTFRSMSGRQIDDARLLIAARRDGSTITFCKLVGSKAEVAAELPAFQQFCGSVRRAR